MYPIIVRICVFLRTQLDGEYANSQWLVRLCVLEEGGCVSLVQEHRRADELQHLPRSFLLHPSRMLPSPKIPQYFLQALLSEQNTSSQARASALVKTKRNMFVKYSHAETKYTKVAPGCGWKRHTPRLGILAATAIRK